MEFGMFTSLHTPNASPHVRQHLPVLPSARCTPAYRPRRRPVKAQCTPQTHPTYHLTPPSASLNVLPNHRRHRLGLSRSPPPCKASWTPHFATMTASQSLAPQIPALVTSVAALLLSVALSLLLLSCIPFVLAAAKAALRMAAVLKVVETELPDTAATMRLSGLEVTDCITEMSALSSELTGGIQATSRLVQATEVNLKQGAALLDSVVKPALARKETETREFLEAELQTRARLVHNRELAMQAAAVARTAVKRAKLAHLGMNVLRVTVGAGQAFRTIADQQARRVVMRQEAWRREYQGGDE